MTHLTELSDSGGAWTGLRVSLFTILYIFSFYFISVNCCVAFSLFMIEHDKDYLHIRCWKESCLAFTCALKNNK